MVLPSLMSFLRFRPVLQFLSEVNFLPWEWKFLFHTSLLTFLSVHFGDSVGWWVYELWVGVFLVDCSSCHCEMYLSGNKLCLGSVLSKQPTNLLTSYVVISFIWLPCLIEVCLSLYSDTVGLSLNFLKDHHLVLLLINVIIDCWCFSFSSLHALFVCVCAHTWVCTVHIWRSEGNLQKSVLFFHRVGPEDQIQVVRLGNKHLELLSRITGPLLSCVLH